uniref:DIS3-like exonuclease 2 n=1 Tax=Rhizophora mucronata TaxID=61149 RepID=A0A2P2K072_RHIMU
MGGAVEQPAVVVERVDDGGGDKEKKKNKRRSSWRSKQNSSSPASCSANEMCGGGLSQSVGNGGKTKNYAASVSILSRQQDFGVNVMNDHRETAASDITFSSMTTMHLNEQAEPLFPSNIDGPIFSNSLIEPIPAGNTHRSYTGKEMHPLHASEGSAECKIFAPYWSNEAVEVALKKGDAFKALFHVNAYNRPEAYCKIEGVPTDILVNGIASQNRAVSLESSCSEVYVLISLSVVTS